MQTERNITRRKIRKGGKHRDVGGRKEQNKQKKKNKKKDGFLDVGAEKGKDVGDKYEEKTNMKEMGRSK